MSEPQSGAMPVDATPQAAAVKAVHHVGLRTLDTTALADFYTAAAGLAPWPALQNLGLPGAGIALCGPNGGLRLLPGAAAVQVRPVSEAGITHLCLQSSQVQALHDRFAAQGASFHSPLVDLGTGFLYCYARDLESNVTELEGVAPLLPNQAPWLAHVNLACADLRAQCSFYGALLGCTAQRSPPLAANARLDQIAGLPGVALRMAWLRSSNMQIELICYTQPEAQASTQPSTRRGAQASGFAYLALEVHDAQAAAEQVAALGGRAHTQAAEPGRAFAADPEGNALWLLQSSWLQSHGAAIEQLSQPDVVQRFEALRHAARDAAS